MAIKPCFMYFIFLMLFIYFYLYILFYIKNEFYDIPKKALRDETLCF